MSAKEYLKRIVEIDKLIDSKQGQINRLRDLCSLKTVSYSDMPKGYNHSDRMSELVSKIVDLREEMNNSIDELVDLKRDAIEKIDSLEDNRYKLILYKKYLMNDTFEQIAVELNLSWKWVHKLHKEALNELNDKFFSKVPKSS